MEIPARPARPDGVPGAYGGRVPMTTAELLPTAPEALRPWIAGVRTLSFTEPAEGTFVQLPDAVTKVVLRVAADGRRDVLAVGPRVRATYHEGTGHIA